MTQKTITDTFLRQAKYRGDKSYIQYTDNSLILRISKQGIKTFRYQYRIGGKMRTLTIGRYPETTLKQARNAIIQAKADLQQGKAPNVQETA